jgi:hypothetical protein
VGSWRQVRRAPVMRLRWKKGERKGGVQAVQRKGYHIHAKGAVRTKVNLLLLLLLLLHRDKHTIARRQVNADLELTESESLASDKPRHIMLQVHTVSCQKAMRWRRPISHPH